MINRESKLPTTPDKDDGSLNGINSDACFETAYHFNNGASLCIVHLSSLGSKGAMEVVFMPGWASTIYTWRHFLARMLKYTSINYFESREKPSSVLSDNAKLTMEAAADDFASYVNANHSDKNYDLIGASMGATTIIEAWPALQQKPRTVTLILPNVRLPLPSSIRILKYVPEGLLGLFKPFVIYFVANFRLTPKEKDQHTGMIKAVESANLGKLRKSSIDLYTYCLSLEKCLAIDKPCLIIGAEKDRLHIASDILAIHKHTPGSTYHDMGSFTAAHSSRAAELINAWIVNYD
jgi:pimeloyl-ACP methyl ester carboxylesterase